tara:strand:- start:111 stop:488 length:378 start_codon:yes stop_codon:yes gene_type:complete
MPQDSNEWIDGFTFEEIENILITGKYDLNESKQRATKNQKKALRERLDEDTEEIELIKSKYNKVSEQAEFITKHYTESHIDRKITTSQYHDLYPNLSGNALNKRLSRLSKQGKITRIGRGEYTFD